MLDWLKQFWIGSEPVEFESAYGLEKSVERLKAATGRSFLSGLTRECAIGTVKESRVSLQRVIPMVGNSFKPFFIGHFVQSGGKVKLVGRFTMNWFVKAFMTAWLSGVGIFAILGTIASIKSPKAAMFPLASFGMFAFAIALMWIGKQFARNDRAWLTELIQTALAAPSPTQATNTANPRDNRLPEKRPTVITIISLALAFSGLIGCLGAITGVQSAHGDANGFVVTHFSHATLRYLAGLYGIAMLALACGIYRRSLFAWQMGFVVLVGSWACSALMILQQDTMEGQHWAEWLFCGISFLVMLYWAWWWKAQRVHFRD